MAAGEDITQFEICDSGGLVMDSIKVQVIFVGIKKENLNMTGKVLEKGNLKIPKTRLGSWVFHTTKNRSDVETLISTGGPIVAFLFALYKSYPHFTAWVDNPENGSFVLDVEKQQKAKILADSAEEMKHNVQKYLSEIENVDLKIKIIKIVRDKPATLKTENPISNTDEETQKKAATSTAETSQHRPQVTSNDWEYLTLKAQIKSTSEKEESRLKTLLKFAICCCKIEKYDEVRSAITEIKELSCNVKIRQQDLISSLENIKTLHQLFISSSKFTESAEIVFATAELLTKLGKQEQRIELMNLFATNVCGSLAKVFAVKPSCFDWNIREEDEIGRSHMEGSGTKWDQANKAQQSGKRAFKKFDFAKALYFYDVAITLQPNEMTHHLDMAEVFLAKNELEKSKEECRKALELKGSDKNKARGFALLGETELRMYQTLQARTNFAESIKLHFNQDIEDKIKILDGNCRTAFQHTITMTAQALSMLNVPPGFPATPSA